MTSKNEPNPTENPILTKLKGKWEAGDFAIDRDSVYGIDEALESAGRQLVDGIPQRGTGSIGPDLGIGIWDGIEAGTFEVENPFSSPNRSEDPLPHRKTCHFCDRTSRDEFCSACYWLIRSSATYIASPHTTPAKEDFHPCYICNGGSILAAICNECEKILLE